MKLKDILIEELRKMEYNQERIDKVIASSDYSFPGIGDMEIPPGLVEAYRKKFREIHTIVADMPVEQVKLESQIQDARRAAENN